MKDIKRIVFTGGPCSGKTTFTSKAQEIFAERGYRVIIDHESATDLISGGISPATLTMYDFQKYCVDLQLKKEELCYRAAKEISGDKVIIFIDRGIFDDMSYVGEEAFKEILKEFDMTLDDINPRYDMVVHLVSSAKGKEEAYTYANNSARYESIDEARHMDDMALEAWKSHPNRVVIGNEEVFEVKMRKAIEAVLSFLGEGKDRIIFKKFLVEVNEEVLDKVKSEANFSSTHILQHYLTSVGGLERRIRKRDLNGSLLYSYSEANYLTTSERIKKERILSERQYYDYGNEIDKSLNPIDKMRYSFNHLNHFLKMDIFDFDKTKAIISVQVDSEDEEVKLPSYIKMIKEVTADKNYKNYYLAKNQKY